MGRQIAGALLLLLAPLLVLGADRPPPELPVLFMPNQGQWPEEILWLARAEGADVLFGPRDVTIRALNGAAGDPGIRLRPLAARADMRLLAERPLPTRLHYFAGGDPRRWRADLPTCGALRYQGIQDGIDLVFRPEAGSRIAYDLELAPGADPGAARLAVEGVRALALADDGALLMTLPDGRQARQHPPRIYQEVGGERRAIAGRFVLQGADPTLPDTQVFGFAVDGHDPDLALVIDPTIDYSALLGGKKTEDVKAVALTSDKRIVVAGSTQSLAVDLFPGYLDPGEKAKGRDGLIYRLNSTGDAIDFLVILGGNGDEQINALALDTDGIYVTGQTASTDFATGDALYPLLPGGKAQAAFVAKLSPSGNAIDFATYFGGSGTDAGKAIAVDADHAIYVGGVTSSADLPLLNSLHAALPGKTAGFLAKLAPGGRGLLLSTYIGGSGVDSVDAIAVDARSRDMYLAGTTTSTDLAVPNAWQPRNAGASDLFVSRLTAAGSEVVFTTYLGGSRNDTLTAMARDPDGHLILTGYTDSTNFPMRNALVSRLAGGLDAFLVKLDRFGGFVHFSTYLGGSGEDRALALSVDSARDLYIAGDTQSTQFPVENPVQGYYAGARDGFLVKLDRYGLETLVSTYFGGTGADSVTALALQGTSTAVLAGTTTATAANTLRFPAGRDGLRPLADFATGTSSFVSRLSQLQANPAIPVLQLGFVGPILPDVRATQPPDDTDIIAIPLTLASPAGIGISAFSTVVTFDPAELTFVGIDWNPRFGTTTQGSTYQYVTTRPMSGGGGETSPGTIELMAYQRSTNLVALPADLATLKFRPSASNVGIIHDPLMPGDSVLPSKQIVLRQQQTTGADLQARDLYIAGHGGGLLIERRCNSLLGDCDCSGLVRLWELQSANLDYGRPALSQPICVKSDYEAMSAGDLLRITANYLLEKQPAAALSRTQTAVASASASAATPVGLDMGLDAAAASTPEPLVTVPATLDLASVRWEGQTLVADLLLNTAGLDLRVVSLDLAYDPATFVAIEAQPGPATLNAGKTLYSSIVQPGLLRVWSHGINTTAIPDGHLGTLRLALDPARGATNTGLTLTATAATPDYQTVRLQGSGFEGSGGLTLTGRVHAGDAPICAWVRANGLETFSCDGQGNFVLTGVSPNEHDQIDIFAFADGLYNTHRVLEVAGLSGPIDLPMQFSPCGTSGGNLGGEDRGIRQADISGTVLLEGSETPLCVAIVSNAGQSTFSCDGGGNFQLTGVPVDAAGQITLLAWGDGLLPHKQTFTPAAAAVGQTLRMRAQCGP